MSVAKQAIAARRKACLDKRYKYGRRDADTAAKRLAQRIAKERMILSGRKSSE